VPKRELDDNRAAMMVWASTCKSKEADLQRKDNPTKTGTKDHFDGAP